MFGNVVPIILKECPELDSNQHNQRSPPPQGGVSTNFTTRANKFCDPTGARTRDPYIKSVLLYQLSYRVFIYLNEAANIDRNFNLIVAVISI